MSFKDLDIKISYISRGEEDIASSLIVPALKQAKLYQRSVGYFSSGVFGLVVDGIVALARNGGHVQLIASPKLEKDDLDAIDAGYRERTRIIEDAFTRTFTEELEKLDDSRLQLLAMLIASNILDIKIVVVGNGGMYHDKLGIIEDQDGNTIVFYGSSNSSFSGYQTNYEKVRVVKSWNPSDMKSVDDEKREFQELWNGTNPFVQTYKYQQAAKAAVLNIVERRKNDSVAKTPPPIKLRDYQEEAISAWVNNSYHGFYVMATGTGKTWTAII